MALIHYYWARSVYCEAEAWWDEDEEQCYCEECGEIPDEELTFVDRDRRIH